MYKILVADDESVEREVVHFLLKQYNFPLEIYDAVNGNDASEKLLKQEYDILLTDIRMPFLDGIQLANKARTLYPDIKIIFFSGYDDFSYVKEALSLHAVNYILKPIDPDEFQKTIFDILTQIHSREKQEKERQSTEGFTKNHILYQLINKVKIKQLEASYPQLEASYPHLDLSFVYCYHRLFFIQLERDFFFPPNLHGFLPQESSFINLNPAQNLLLFAGEKRPLSWYQEFSRKLALKIQNEWHVHCGIAISDTFSHPDEISGSYKDAETYLTERLFFMDTSLINCSAPMESLETDSPVDDDMILKQIEMDIQFKDSFCMKKHLMLLLNSHKKPENNSQIYFRFLCTNILKLLLNGLSSESKQSFDSYVNVILQSNHVSEIETLLLDLSNQLSRKLEKDQESPKHALQLVKQYIHNHYSEDLSLDILAKEVYLTPHYLSALFIEETGCGINRYIKNVRMKKAQELLLNTNLKVNDICRQVGYSNLSYFCKSFAEETGTTPNNFRQNRS